jgi:hypothetical protein
MTSLLESEGDGFARRRVVFDEQDLEHLHWGPPLTPIRIDLSREQNIFNRCRLAPADRYQRRANVSSTLHDAREISHFFVLRGTAKTAADDA